MGLQVEQFMCRTDNFGILIRDEATGTVGLIDAPEEGPILQAIERTGWTPSVLFVTHHHPDHVEANLALKARFKLKIVGPKAEAAKIPGIDETVEEGSDLDLRRGACAGDRDAGAYGGACQLCLRKVGRGVHRRHAVRARLRAAVRGHAGDDARFAQEACRPASGHAGLLRP